MSLSVSLWSLAYVPHVQALCSLLSSSELIEIAFARTLERELRSLTFAYTLLTPERPLDTVCRRLPTVLQTLGV